MAKEVEGKGRSQDLVRGWGGVRASERREQGRGAGGSAGLRKRDGFSSHTSNYCVTGD